MVVIRGHFDGSVIVPDEPVSLPPDSAVIVLVSGDERTAPALEAATREYYQSQTPDELAEDEQWGSTGAGEAWGTE